MKVYFQIIVFFIGFQLLGYSQTPDSLLRNNRNAVFFAPLNLLDFTNPSIQIGYERFLKPQLSVQIEGGYIIKQSIVNYFDKDFSEDDQSAKGYKVKLGVKYYWFRDTKIKPYVSCELFHTKNNLILSHFRSDYAKSLTVSDSDYENYYAKYDIKRTGLNIKFGVKFPLGKYLFLEPHIGFGIVYNDIDKKGKLHDDDDSITSKIAEDFFAIPKSLDVNLPLNIKLGINF